jgi:endonuclease/exonuclease/phosphatase family metal-dependent hydrolase
VRVGTWNIRRLGHGDKRLDLVARAFDHFDVVAVQEVMDDDAVDELLTFLPGWKAAVTSRPLGRSRYVEYYAVFFRADTVELTEAYIAEDPDDAFARDPLVACFVVVEPDTDFCIATIHVVYGNRVGPRDAEIAALGDVVSAARTASTEKDWIVLGDFNRSGTRPGWPTLLDAGWEFTLGDGTVPTTIGRDGYRNPYDHVLVDPTYTDTIGDARRVDIVHGLCDGDFASCAKTVSDHTAVVLTIDATGPDDD